MAWGALRALLCSVVFVVLPTAGAWAQDELPELPGLGDPDIEAELSDPRLQNVPEEDRAERAKQREALLGEVESEQKELKAKVTKYRDLAIETQAKRDRLKKEYAAALAEVASELRVLLDTKLATIDFVTAQVAAQEAELALISATDERLAACHRYEEELQSLAAKLQKLNVAGDKRISAAEMPRAKAALLRARLRTLDEIAPVFDAEEFANRLARLELLRQDHAVAKIRMFDGTLNIFGYAQTGRAYYHELAACSAACGQMDDAWSDAQKAVQHSCGEMQAVEAMIGEGFGDPWSSDDLMNAAARAAHEIIIVARNASKRSGKPIPELKRLMELTKFQE